MGLDLVDYERKTREAVKAFWGNRAAAKRKQVEAGKADQGERAGVTPGKNMDGFVALVIDIVRANGLEDATVHTRKSLLTLPGFFRPTKQWDLLVMQDEELIAAVELKSHIGPSFGNNFNNRAEEAIGTAHDLSTAIREGALGNQSHPFLGWLMMVEDAPESRCAVKTTSPHFDIFNEFKMTSYIERYDLLCQKLVREQLYTSATAIASPRTAVKTGAYSDISKLSSLTGFVTTLAGHVAAVAARREISGDK